MMPKRNPIARNTLYLHGMQSHFDAAIKKALALDAAKKHIAYNISIDVVQSIWNREVVFKVDYAVVEAQDG